jgi:hypothetical protein
MGFVLEELSADNPVDPATESEPEDPRGLVFDDEPLEGILYGENARRPTRANLFWPGLVWVREIKAACGAGDIRQAVTRASEFAANRYTLTPGMCRDLAPVMSAVVPSHPNPILEHDLSPLAPLVGALWSLALREKDKALQEALGTSLYRWYEHHQRYEDAKRILAILIEICRERHDEPDEAVLLNNLAFEYLLEERWQEAAPLFERAAALFKAHDQEYQHANSRANYWTCRFETEELDGLDGIEGELQTLGEILEKRPGWHARKPLILLARIRERRGKIKAAIGLVKRAVASARGSGTRYPEEDARYLEELREKRRRSP